MRPYTEERGGCKGGGGGSRPAALGARQRTMGFDIRRVGANPPSAGWIDVVGVRWACLDRSRGQWVGTHPTEGYDDEARFDAKLKKVAKAPKPTEQAREKGES